MVLLVSYCRYGIGMALVWLFFAYNIGIGSGTALVSYMGDNGMASA